MRERLDGLPHNHRDVLVLRELQGLSTPEICELLDISPANLRVSLHRAARR